MTETPSTISEYLRAYGPSLSNRVLQQFPALHTPDDEPWPALARLKRRPFPAQTLAIMGIVKRWQESRSAGAIAECGTGKTLISLGSVFTSANGRPFTCLTMVPPQLVEKWARECFLTLPGVRVFLIDGVRNGLGSNGFSGVNEVRLRNGRVVREGLRTTLSDLRLAKTHRSARARWRAQVPAPSIWIVSRERAKLGYFWRHAYRTPSSGPYRGNVVNSDTGMPVILGDDQLRRSDFRKIKFAETVAPDELNGRKPFFSPLWQADNAKIHRMAPIEFIGRYLGDGFFDYGIADEVHELKSGETAQGNALGTLAAACDRTVVLTGTLLGGYADELFMILYRLDPRTMKEDGFGYGESGIRQFAETYGVLEKVTTIEPSDNACSKAKATTTVKRRPGASPLLFGKYLMNLAAFVSLEDISDALPPYQEEVVAVEMDPALRKAYTDIEDAVRTAIRENHGNASVLSTAMNALLLYPDRPFGLGTLYGNRTNDDGQRERFVIAEPADLPQDFVYAKERRLIEEIKGELALGRKVQVYAVFTQKRDVTRRLQELLRKEGIRAEVLTSAVPPEQREAWYERQRRIGTQVCIGHPILTMTGLDLWEYVSIFFVQTGYSTYVLRQASRRSWRIGQKKPVRVAFFSYSQTAQESCLRLMGRKLQVSLAMEGRLTCDGLQSTEDDDDILTAMARELVTRQGVGEAAAAVWRTLQIDRKGAIPQLAEPGTETEPPGPDLLVDRTTDEPWQRSDGPAVQLSLF
jgi:superfamily II DNA or RNA helicase